MLMKAVMGSVSFLREHPLALLQAARNAARMELSLPLNLLRWAIDRRPRGKGPERIELHSNDPAIGLGLTVDLYGTKIDVSASIELESIDLSINGESALRVVLRVRELQVKAPPNSPAAMMIQSLDLSRPGALLKMMPQKHAVLVSASDDRFELDLLQIPAIGKNAKVLRTISALSFLRVRGARVEGPLLALGLEVHPLAIPGAFRRAGGV